jgi:hypothetical protein
MYSLVLILHSWFRWAALVAGFGAILAVVRKQDSAMDRWGLILMMLLDTQMLLGLLLYLALSPNMQEILSHFDASMKDPATRFWAVEHVTAMMGAVIVAHIGRVLARKAKTPAAKRMRLLICFGLATVLMLVGIPWPGRPGGRMLFRGFNV